MPENVPTHGIGHSNGSLMHLLIGSFFQAPYDSNVLLSYNNKEVDDAIPIPGAFRFRPIPVHSRLSFCCFQEERVPLQSGLERARRPCYRCQHTSVYTAAALVANTNHLTGVHIVQDSA